MSTLSSSQTCEQSCLVNGEREREMSPTINTLKFIINLFSFFLFLSNNILQQKCPVKFNKKKIQLSGNLSTLQQKLENSILTKHCLNADMRFNDVTVMNQLYLH